MSVCAVLRINATVVLSGLLIIGCSSSDETPDGAVGNDATSFTDGSTDQQAGDGEASDDALPDSGSDSGSDSGLPLTRRGGTRLKLKENVADGVSAAVSFWDDQLELDCSPILTEGGALRCLPPALFEYPGPLFDFSDDGCTRPLFAATSELPYLRCEGIDRYIWIEDSKCTQPERTLPTWPVTTVLKVGAEASGSGPIYTLDEEGVCVEATRQANATYFSTEELPLDSFVEVKPSPLDDSVRLVSDAVFTDDGAMKVVGFYDNQRAEACTFQVADDDDVERCLPRYRTASPHPMSFSDDACSTPAFFGIFLDCRAPLYAVEGADRCAGGKTKVFEIGTKVDPAYRMSEGVCGASTFSAYDYYAAGTAIEAEEFVAGSFEEHGGGRIKAVYVRAGDAYKQLGLRDSKLDVACYFKLTSDGKRRCVPVGERVSFMYADDACKNPVAQLTCPPASHPTHVYVQNFGGDVCKGRPVSIYPTVDTIAKPDKLYELSNGACVPVVSIPDGPFVSIGPQLVDTEFVEGVETLR